MGKAGDFLDPPPSRGTGALDSSQSSMVSTVRTETQCNKMDHVVGFLCKYVGEGAAGVGRTGGLHVTKDRGFTADGPSTVLQQP